MNNLRFQPSSIHFVALFPYRVTGQDPVPAPFGQKWGGHTKKERDK